MLRPHTANTSMFANAIQDSATYCKGSGVNCVPACPETGQCELVGKLPSLVFSFSVCKTDTRAPILQIPFCRVKDYTGKGAHTMSEKWGFNYSLAQLYKAKYRNK